VNVRVVTIFRLIAVQMSLNLEAPTYSTLMIPIYVLTVWAGLSQAQHKGAA
jgi:hypothetical protein